MVLSKNDYDALSHFLRTNNPELKYDRLRAENLLEEINTAEVLNNS